MAEKIWCGNPAYHRRHLWTAPDGRRVTCSGSPFQPGRGPAGSYERK